MSIYKGSKIRILGTVYGNLDSMVKCPKSGKTKDITWHKYNAKVEQYSAFLRKEKILGKIKNNQKKILMK